MARGRGKTMRRESNTAAAAPGDAPASTAATTPAATPLAATPSAATPAAASDAKPEATVARK